MNGEIQHGQESEDSSVLMMLLSQTCCLASVISNLHPNRHISLVNKLVLRFIKKTNKSRLIKLPEIRALKEFFYHL